MGARTAVNISNSRAAGRSTVLVPRVAAAAGGTPTFVWNEVSGSTTITQSGQNLNMGDWDCARDNVNGISSGQHLIELVCLNGGAASVHVGFGTLASSMDDRDVGTNWLGTAAGEIGMGPGNGVLRINGTSFGTVIAGGVGATTYEVGIYIDFDALTVQFINAVIDSGSPTWSTTYSIPAGTYYLMASGAAGSTAKIITNYSTPRYSAP